MKKGGWLFNNFLSKILSLLIAVALWFFVVFENMPEVTFIIPLQLRNQPRNVALVGNVEGRDIEVRLRAPKAIMSGFSSQQVEAVIDLSDLSPGEHSVTITPDKIYVPRKVRIVGISPTSVMIRLESIVSRMIKVDPVILGVPANGYLLKEVRVFPEQVKVFGAKSVLEKLKTFSTDSVDIGGANKTLIAKVHITPPGRNIRLAASDLVEVRPIIVEQEVEKEFQSIPIIVIPPGMQATLQPDRINVLLHGPRSKLAQIKSEDLIATVNILDLPEGINMTAPKLSPPEGVSLIKIIPGRIEVIEVIAVTQEEDDELIRPMPGQQVLPQKTDLQPPSQIPEKQAETGFSVPLQLKNRPPNMALTHNMEVENIEVSLKGPQSIISALTAQQLEAIIDCGNLGPGEITIPFTSDVISVPDLVDVVRMSPSSIIITLEPVISRLIKVKPVITGVPADGYLLKEVRIFPEYVKVIGIKSMVEKQITLSTDPVDIKNANRPFIAEASINIPQGNIRLADDEYDTVEVRPIIVEEEEVKEFPAVSIIVIPPGTKVTLKPDRINVILKGARSKIAQIKAEDLIATVNPSDLPQGQNKAVPRISLPEGISLVKIIPDQVEIIEISQQETDDIPSPKPVKQINPPIPVEQPQSEQHAPPPNAKGQPQTGRQVVPPAITEPLKPERQVLPKQTTEHETQIIPLERQKIKTDTNNTIFNEQLRR